jgi:hypothetical protein
VRERVIFQNENDKVPVAALEMLLRRRIGWADGLVSPFARAGTCAMIIAEPNRFAKEVHNRAPVAVLSGRVDGPRRRTWRYGSGVHWDWRSAS